MERVANFVPEEDPCSCPGRLLFEKLQTGLSELSDFFRLVIPPPAPVVADLLPGFKVVVESEFCATLAGNFRIRGLIALSCFSRPLQSTEGYGR